MLGLETSYRLRDLFKVICDLEHQIETQRQLVGQMEAFEPYAMFCRVNRHADKRISSLELSAYLR